MDKRPRQQEVDEAVNGVAKRRASAAIASTTKIMCRWPGHKWPSRFPKDIWKMILCFVFKKDIASIFNCRETCASWCNWLDGADGMYPGDPTKHYQYDLMRNIWLGFRFKYPALSLISRQRPVFWRWSQYCSLVSLRHANMESVLKKCGPCMGTLGTDPHHPILRLVSGMWILKHAATVYNMVIPCFPDVSAYPAIFRGAIGRMNIAYGQHTPAGYDIHYQHADKSTLDTTGAVDMMANASMDVYSAFAQYNDIKKHLSNVTLKLIKYIDATTGEACYRLAHRSKSIPAQIQIRPDHEITHGGRYVQQYNTYPPNPTPGLNIIRFQVIPLEELKDVWKMIFPE